jgi:Transposase DDE domain
MALNLIKSACRCLLKLPSRLQEVTEGYLFSLMIPAPKHTQEFASQVTGTHQTQFSRLLSEHREKAQESLELLGIARAQEITKKGLNPVVKGGPWTAAVIIDATLHERSSLHVHNSQRFNHGEGFVIGHQWTNIVLLLNEEVIALPPIPFVSKNECRRVGIEYRTEHEKIVEYLERLDLRHYIGEHTPSSVLALMDSGYDNKQIQKTCFKKKWDLIGSLKCNRGVQAWSEGKIDPKRKWIRLDELFRTYRKQTPWQSVRDEVRSGKRKKKRKEFRTRRLMGRLKDVHRVVSLVCSEKSKGEGRIYLVCSNLEVPLGVVIRAYRRRWLIELFHRAVKANLGMQHAGVRDFESQQSHVHWVYCAYILLNRLPAPSSAGISERQQWLHQQWEEGRARELHQITTQYGGLRTIQKRCKAAFQKEDVA